MPDHGQMRAAISNAIVALMKEYYGKGPTAAKTYLNDEYVFTVLEGGLTRNEETMIHAGEQDFVRLYRLKYQQVVRHQLIGVVQDITGTRVLDYHSQVVFDPPRGFEMFVLESPPGPVSSSNDQ